MSQHPHEHESLDSRTIADMFPDIPGEGIFALTEYYEGHMSHLSGDDGEIAPTSEYMDLLQKSAETCHAFFACSRMSARDLLWGDYADEDTKFNIVKRSLPRLAKFAVRRGISIVVTCIAVFQASMLFEFVRVPGLDIKNPDETFWSALILLLVLFMVAFFWLRYEYEEYKSTQHVQNEEVENSKHVSARFEQYNRILGKKKNKHPVTRVFVLNKQQIDEDEKHIDRHMKKTWWGKMVELHAEHGIEIARFCLTEKLKINYPQLDRQFSMFIVPGQKGWIIVTRKQSSRSVTISCQGRKAFHRYRNVFREVARQSKKSVYENGEGLSERGSIHDFCLCMDCSEKARQDCDYSDCSERCQILT